MNLRTILPAALLALTACGGGGASVPAAPSGGPLQGTMSIAIPLSADAASAQARKAQYVSPNTTMAYIAAGSPTSNALSFFAPYDVSATSSLCSTGSGNRTCTLPVSVPAGQQGFQVFLLDANNNLLSFGYGQFNIQQNSFSCSVQLVPTPAKYTLTYSTGNSFVHGVASTATWTWQRVDADGLTIPSTAVIPNFPIFSGLQLSLGTTNSHVTIAPTTVTSLQQQVTISYDGQTAALPSGVTINLTVTSNTLQTAGVQAPVISLATVGVQ